MMSPLSCRAEAGVSIKVFMPLLDYKLLVFACQVLGFRQLLGLESNGFAENHLAFDFENSFAVSPSHMDMDGSVIIAVEEEAISVFCEYCRHQSEFLALM